MNFIYTIDLIGTFVFAISGILVGLDKKFDIVGTSILGLVTAVGGGTLRDVLIGETPAGWMKDLNYLYAIFGALPICYFFKKSILKIPKSMFLFDTIGIGLFTILGVQKTLSVGLLPPVAILMGAVSAVFGGVIRDVLANDIPIIFRKEVYASACLVGGIVYLLMHAICTNEVLNMALAMATVMLIRYLAVRFQWSLYFEAKSLVK